MSKIFKVNDIIIRLNLFGFFINLLLKYIKEQVMSFPNLKLVIQSWIVVSGYLLDSIILNVKITMTDVPPVQHSTLFRDANEAKIK